MDDWAGQGRIKSDILIQLQIRAGVKAIEIKLYFVIVLISACPCFCFKEDRDRASTFLW